MKYIFNPKELIAYSDYGEDYIEELQHYVNGKYNINIPHFTSGCDYVYVWRAKIIKTKLLTALFK